MAAAVEAAWTPKFVPACISRRQQQCSDSSGGLEGNSIDLVGWKHGNIEHWKDEKLIVSKNLWKNFWRWLEAQKFQGRAAKLLTFNWRGPACKRWRSRQGV